MLKTVLATLVMLACSIGGGAASLWYVLADPDATGALTVGQWTAFPKIGAPDADPYAKARVAREGVLALGSAEGVAFVATRDQDGRRLRLECTYRVEGATPPSRFWTLFADGSAAPADVRSGAGLPALNSWSMARQPDNSVRVTVSPQPAPGNWLGVAGSGPMTLVLTVYDAALSRDVSAATTTMPAIVPAGCAEPPSPPTSNGA